VYEDADVENLDFCAVDAEAVADVLRLPQYGFDVRLLLNEEATRAAVLSCLINQLDANLEVFAIFFAGHGGVTELGSYLITHDAAPFNEGVELSELVGLLTRIAAEGTNAMAILDCCHAGGAALASSTLTAESLDPSDVRQAFANGAGSRGVLAACLADEESAELETLGHGLFTHHLLEGLYGGAADANGRISLNSLHEYLAVPFEAETGQTPVFYASIAGSFALAEGFEPQLGPRLDEHELQELAQQARDHVDDFRRRLSSPEWADWTSTGYRSACVLLGQIEDWITKRLREQPRLELRPKFSDVLSEIRRQRANLGVLQPGLELVEGIVVGDVGSGGFGTVWRVHPSTGGPDLAYKVYLSQYLSDAIKTTRFRRGFDAMQRLDHPRVVRVHRYSDVPLGFYMDFIDGPNLRAIDPASTLQPRAIVRLLIEVAEAVAHAHDRDVVHRDIKPENIVCRYGTDGSWEPFLTDFDLAWINTATQVTREGIGNYLYAAPEQLMNFTAKAVAGFRPTLDVFSLGQLAYFCATGSDPNPTQTAENRSNLERTLSGWPSGEAAMIFNSVYANAAAERPAGRYQSVTDLLQDLLDLERATLPERLAEDLGPDQFKAELAFAFTGRPETVTIDRPTVFQSLSGQSRLTLTHKLRQHGLADITAHIMPSQPLALEGQPNDAMRRRLNARADRALRERPDVRTRPGSVGTYSLYVEFLNVALDRTGLARIRRDLTDVLRVIEGS
jgi:serine/threonine protein kinase